MPSSYRLILCNKKTHRPKAESRNIDPNFSSSTAAYCVLSQPTSAPAFIAHRATSASVACSTARDRSRSRTLHGEPLSLARSRLSLGLLSLALDTLGLEQQLSLHVSASVKWSVLATSGSVLFLRPALLLGSCSSSSSSTPLLCLPAASSPFLSSPPPPARPRPNKPIKHALALSLARSRHSHSPFPGCLPSSPFRSSSTQHSTRHDTHARARRKQASWARELLPQSRRPPHRTPILKSSLIASCHFPKLASPLFPSLPLPSPPLPLLPLPSPPFRTREQASGRATRLLLFLLAPPPPPSPPLPLVTRLVTHSLTHSALLCLLRACLCLRSALPSSRSLAPSLALARAKRLRARSSGPAKGRAPEGAALYSRTPRPAERSTRFSKENISPPRPTTTARAPLLSAPPVSPKRKSNGAEAIY